MNKIKFLMSIENELDLFRDFYKGIGNSTGENDYEIFLGYLKDELLEKFKGKSDEEVYEIVKEVLEREYEKHDKLLKHNLDTIEKQWADIEPEFIEASEKLFDGHPFPSGEYKAYISLWGRFVRHLDGKSLSFPCNTDMMLMVVVHEMLHFMFFDYFEKNFEKEWKKNQAWIWELSEIMNVLIMNEDPFLKWVKFKSQPYPAHEKNYEKLLPLYEGRKSIEEFIEKAVEILEGSN